MCSLSSMNGVRLETNHVKNLLKREPKLYLQGVCFLRDGSLKLVVVQTQVIQQSSFVGAAKCH